MKNFFELVFWHHVSQTNVTCTGSKRKSGSMCSSQMQNQHYTIEDIMAIKKVLTEFLLNTLHKKKSQIDPLGEEAQSTVVIKCSSACCVQLH